MSPFTGQINISKKLQQEVKHFPSENSVSLWEDKSFSSCKRSQSMFQPFEKSSTDKLSNVSVTASQHSRHSSRDLGWTAAESTFLSFLIFLQTVVIFKRHACTKLQVFPNEFTGRPVILQVAFPGFRNTWPNECDIWWTRQSKLKSKRCTVHTYHKCVWPETMISNIARGSWAPQKHRTG